MKRQRHLWRSSALAACVLAFTGACGHAAAQAGSAWAWVGGNDKIDQPGNYGTLGVPSPANLPPGRGGATAWTDKSGNFWLFGGSGYDPATNAIGVLLDDLWEYSPVANQWTWVGGSDSFGRNDLGVPGVYGNLGTPAPQSLPGSRSGAAGWTDGDGNFWLFGGFGDDATGVSSDLNDLWKYTPSTGNWAWMGGSSVAGPTYIQPGIYGTQGVAAPQNVPGGRSAATAWTDPAGNFWLLGGSGSDANDASGQLNDRWTFSPRSNEWTWMGGSSTLPAGAARQNKGWPGVYGTLDTPAAGNIPGSRASGASWLDAKGNFWLLGGDGLDENGIGAPLNDLWKLDLPATEWVWVGGSATSAGCTTYASGFVFCSGRPGVYGTFGTPSPGNIPGGRGGAVSWVDETGMFWLFGGQGYDSAGDQGNLNDLWKYDPSSGSWAWLGGNDTEGNCELSPEGITVCGGQPGVYGSINVPAPGNDPGGRAGAANWADLQGNLWLFGGYGVGATGNQPSALNDLWKYVPAQAALASAALPAFSPAPGTYLANQSIVLSDSTPGATLYYTTDGVSPPRLRPSIPDRSPSPCKAAR